jgi:hypothetical protein
VLLGVFDLGQDCFAGNELEEDHASPAQVIGPVGGDRETPSTIVLGDKLAAHPFDGLYGFISPGFGGVVSVG